MGVSDLPGTLVFDYPTVAAMSAYLTDRLVPPPQHAQHAQRAQRAQSNSGGGTSGRELSGGAGGGLAAAGGRQGAAIVVAGVRARLAQLPGSCAAAVPSPAGSAAAGSLFLSSAALLAAEDPITTIPLDRWDTDFGRSLTKFRAGGGGGTGGTAFGGGRRFGGFVLDWAAFDPEAFAIPASGGCRAVAGSWLGGCRLVWWVLGWLLWWRLADSGFGGAGGRVARPQP